MSQNVKICVMSQEKWLKLRYELTSHFLPLCSLTLPHLHILASFLTSSHEFLISLLISCIPIQDEAMSGSQTRYQITLMKNYIPSTYDSNLIFFCRSFEVWVRAVWVWGRSEISWPLAQTSWPGSLRPSSWDSLFLDRGISISIRLCGQTFGRSQRNSHLNQLKHKKMLSSMKVIYLTLTSCSFPILYYTSIESNMERMWWTVERIFREKLKLDFLKILS